jgi:hypothetical protein
MKYEYTYIFKRATHTHIENCVKIVIINIGRETSAVYFCYKLLVDQFVLEGRHLLDSKCV